MTRPMFWRPLVALSIASVCAAQDLSVPGPAGVTVRRIEVDARVAGDVAETTVDQVFHSSLPAVAEGVYVFPLPEAVAVRRFSMFVGGAEVQGELLDADRARAIYESIVESRRDPGLLEFAGRGLIRARVFPIPPGGDVRIRLAYAQELRTRQGATVYECPVGAWGRAAEPLDEVRIRVRVESEVPLGSIWSSTHSIRTAAGRTGREAVVEHEGSRVTPGRTFRLHVQRTVEEVGVSLLAHRPPGRDGYFLLLASPGLGLDPEEVFARDLSLVVDTSGSMLGAKLDQARRDVRDVLARLTPLDRFRLVRFADDATASSGAPVPATAENVEAALDFLAGLRARGETDLAAGLAEAAAAPAGEGRLHSVVVWTDGRQETALRSSGLPSGTNLSVVGLGDDFDPTRFDRVVLGSAEELVEATSNVLLTDLTVSFEGVPVTEVYPSSRLPDLRQGGRVAVLGRYSGEGPLAVRIAGRSATRPHTVRFETAMPGLETGDAFVATLWARRRLDALLGEASRRGETPELRRAIVRLGEEYGLVTPFTSYYAPEPGTRAVTGRVPVLGAPASPADEPRVRRVADKVFQLHGHAWIETGRPARPARTEVVRFLGPRWYELVRSSSLVARYLSVGDRVEFDHGGTRYDVRP